MSSSKRLWAQDQKELISNPGTFWRPHQATESPRNEQWLQTSWEPAPTSGSRSTPLPRPHIRRSPRFYPVCLPQAFPCHAVLGTPKPYLGAASTLPTTNTEELNPVLTTPPGQGRGFWLRTFTSASGSQC
ncbi:hypothetical protein P7K49_033212 [Saguinus oedipus]|uniref:Uncharacterized protein n=1 Tax=Saguinus oedipus TaxID=9490 RepID=A0ABQ9TRA1_SAGOE|nr:hypothetical protein P7K49_033212 [Saguinus oedipus]